MKTGNVSYIKNLVFGTQFSFDCHAISIHTTNGKAFIFIWTLLYDENLSLPYILFG